MAGGLLFLAYPILLWQQTRHPWGFVGAYKYWQRHVSVYGPFDGLWKGIHAAWYGCEQLLGLVAHPNLATNPDRIAVLNIENVLFLFLFIALTVLVWRRLGAAYGIFATLSVAIPISTPPPYYPLDGLPRYVLVVFPLYIVLAQLGARLTTDRLIIGLSGLLLGATTVQWALAEWVS